MKYKGSCHCGQIAYEVEGELDGVLSCNCSICSRKGSLLWFVPRTQFRLVTDPTKVSTYTFNKHHIEHKFCANCGIHPYAWATGPDGREMAAINTRCLESVDFAALPVTHFDGRSR